MIPASRLDNPARDTRGTEPETALGGVSLEDRRNRLLKADRGLNSIQGLDLFTTRPGNVDKSHEFYVRHLGLVDGERTPLNAAGHWLYSANEAPTVHLLHGDESSADATRTTGRSDHIAFASTGLAAMKQRIEKHGIKLKEQTIPARGQTQLFPPDQDGVTVELNFAAEKRPQ